MLKFEIVKGRILITVLLLIGFTFIAEPVLAQCPMCRAAAETSIQQGDTTASGLNTGILYLFLAPYLLVATIGFLMWRARNKAEAV